MEIHSPPHRIAWISRLIGADGEVTFFHSSLDCSPKVDQISDLGLVDFLDDGSDLDAGRVRARAPNHFEYRDTLRSLELQFFSDVFIHIPDHHTEFFSQSLGFLHGHRLLIRRIHRRKIGTAQGSETETGTQDKGPSTPKNLFLVCTDQLDSNILQRLRLS